MTSLPQISIIIPVLNEENLIQQQLNSIIKQVSDLPIVREIIVVDGGSSDDTVKIASSFSQVKVLSSEKGRAKQMNLGAKNAKAEILYFLHIDSIPPTDFDLHILVAHQNSAKAGCFRMKFRSNHLWLKLMGWFTRFNHRSCRGGDQSLYVDRNLFWTLGGYNEEYIIYEDNEFISKLYTSNSFTVIPETLSTSARMYITHGVAKLQYLYVMIYLKRWLGATPDELYNYFIRNTKKS